ncbi:hypothetical protein SAMN05216466_13542 [Paraburkholderia phenazinium]|uniref:Zinc-ribbon domain-containing protein n=2 Tax=Paraburkholderia phenazinium TaxID=60549 RepID=A0A1G8NKN5_9BURK|nr:hypothetical protein SAMN05216466_13542 [Paraburkholderia phenazinium]
MPRRPPDLPSLTREEFETLVAAARRPGKLGRPISDRSAAMARAVLIDGLTFTQAALAQEGHISTAYQAVSLLLRHRTEAADLSAQRLRDEQLDQIRSKFVDAGLSLLDASWRGQNVRYRLRCERGHEWERGGQQLLRIARIACPDCLVEDGMKRMHDIARQSGGHCLTSTYLGLKGRYRFVCAIGHEFETTAATIFRGCWCPICSNMRRAERQLWAAGGLLPIQNRARERGGECLSTVYEGKSAQYRFRCVQGHEWETSGIEVMREAWCPQCVYERARRPDGLAELQRVAVRRGGKCLASGYQRIQTRYPFQCERGHEWLAWGSEILKGSWCPTCRTEDRQRRGIETMHAIAAERGGRCLSDTYVDNQTKLEWECARGHRWWARPRQIASAGNWCAQCGFLSRITREKTRRKRRYEAVKAVG